LESKISLCIHGHFYQPPRENPWTDEIELQLSASPFHDWNERIYQECYRPNTEAIITDDKGKVVKRINNYEFIDFNFGPTLFNWMKEKHPKNFSKIIEADKKSVNAHNGHGNAIAQVYNHLIMPLANRQDKITQTKWGLKHFNYYFGRDSEGIWLAETACNKETLEILVNEEVKFTILDPSQALMIKKINSKDVWEDVSGSKINPKEPYRYFIDEKKEKYIDIFFYDGPFARSIAFEDLVYSADRIIDRLEWVKIKNYNKDQLISIAVDGETFGHHKHFTERTIAYLLTELAPKKGYKTVNFGEYLSEHQPQYEVMINDGKNGEGTSWSCLHGVGRWKEDCGCNTGGQAGWNQKWREPLRNSLNILRDRLILMFEGIGHIYLKNVWDARNDYIKLMLDNSKENVLDFFERHSKKKLKKDEKEICFKLFEMQKFSMYMFTSCGWFFSDISGIETIQVLEYAKRAIEINEELTGDKAIEEEFLNELEKAKSNKPEYVDGKKIYLRNIKK
jgi:alpha-amylase/alpha-mannosidase (GH57 family)